MIKLTYEDMKQKCYYIKCETQEQFNKVLDWIKLCYPEELTIQKRKLWERFKRNATIGVTKKDVISFGQGMDYPFILYFEDIELMKPNTYNEIKAKFNLEKLRGKKVVVNCRTKEQFLNYKEFIYHIGCPIDYFNSWLDFKENTCILLNANSSWTYDEIDWYKESGCKVISYEEALLKEDKIEDMACDKISFTKEQLKKFYLEAYNAGGLSKIVCGGLSNKDINNLDDRSWMEALIKAYN